MWGTTVFSISDQGSIEQPFHTQNQSIIKRACRRARNVGKVVIVQKESPDQEAKRIKESQSRQPICEGSAIKLSDKLLVTANHVLISYNEQKHDIYVHFSSQPVMAHYISLDHEGSDWIQVEPIERLKGEEYCNICELDFAFLKTIGSEDIRIPSVPIQLPDCKRTSLLIGFVQYTESNEDYVDIFPNGNTLPEIDFRQFILQGGTGWLKRKLIFQGDIEDVDALCDHILHHNCFSGSGVSGGLVLFIDDQGCLHFCAMHRGVINDKGVCLKADQIFQSQLEHKEAVENPSEDQGNKTHCNLDRFCCFHSSRCMLL